MRIYFLILFLFAFSLVNGQFTEPKFSKISIPDLLMNKYDKDTTAEALMLFDNGNTPVYSKYRWKISICF